MKLPNGYGSITKLSGNRRKPWRVRKTDRWEWVSTTEMEWIDKTTKKVVSNPTPEQIAFKQVKQRAMVIEKPTLEQLLAKEVKEHRIYMEIGCYATKQEAIAALVAYNEDPYDIRLSSITFDEVYEKWSEIHYEKVKDSNGYKAAYNLCGKLGKMRFVDITLDHLQRVVDESGKNTPTLKTLKIMFGLMWDYAVLHDIVTQDRRDKIKHLDISKPGNPNAYDRKPFSSKEVKTVWKWKDTNDYFKVILMLIYSGCRISEMLDLKKENVNLEEKWFDITASKTQAGIRKVPISEKVLPFFQEWMNKNDCEYLLSTPDAKHFEYRNYYDSYWTPLIEQMGMKHTPHCTRHTCISMLAEAGVDERIVKKIVGHKGQGVTQVVYTHFEIESLLEAINKI